MDWVFLILAATLDLRNEELVDFVLVDIRLRNGAGRPLGQLE